MLNGVFLSKEAEAMNVREDLSWMEDLEMDYILVEVDALQVYDTLHLFF